MDCFGTYFTHVQKALLWTWQPAHMEHTKYTAVRLLKTCTWQPAHMEHTKYTAVRTKVYIQQNHSACTDETLGRVYRWGPWPRVQTRPLPLRPWPEPSACTCDPRKRVHSRPPDPFVTIRAVFLLEILSTSWAPFGAYLFLISLGNVPGIPFIDLNEVAVLI